MVKIPMEECSKIIRAVIDGAIDTIGADVTFVHLRMMQEIARGHISDELMGVTEVARNLGLPMSTASRMVSQLGNFDSGGKGYVTQVSHPKDRRRVVLQLTQLGIDTRNKHLTFVSRQISPLIENLAGN